MVLKLLYRTMVVGTAGVFLWANIVYHSTAEPCSTEEKHHVESLLRKLEKGMHGSVPRKMQSLFPEGAAFAYALYGLARCEQTRFSSSEELHAREEAWWSLRQLEGADARERFNSSLEPEGGAFIAGWTAYLQAKCIEVDPSAGIEEHESFRQRCDRIAVVLQSDAVPYLQSYHGQAWPADVVVCVAALALHDRIAEPRYAEHRSRWVEGVRKRLDDRGMIPHAWLSALDEVHQTARGSSMSLMCVFLRDIDKDLAREQYALFTQHFLDSRFGMAVALEHPKGVHKPGDIDSGPLILGAGPAATIVAAAACRANGDANQAQLLARTVDAWGFIKGSEEREYLLGAMPIADLFIAWGRATQCNSIAGKVNAAPKSTFPLWSLLFCALLAGPWMWSVLKGRTNRAQ
jgi:hypothetical protein